MELDIELETDAAQTRQAEFLSIASRFLAKETTLEQVVSAAIRFGAKVTNVDPPFNTLSVLYANLLKEKGKRYTSLYDPIVHQFDTDIYDTKLQVATSILGPWAVPGFNPVALLDDQFATIRSLKELSESLLPITQSASDLYVANIHRVDGEPISHNPHAFMGSKAAWDELISAGLLMPMSYDSEPRFYSACLLLPISVLSPIAEATMEERLDTHADLFTHLAYYDDAFKEAIQPHLDELCASRRLLQFRAPGDIDNATCCSVYARVAFEWSCVFGYKNDLPIGDIIQLENDNKFPTPPYSESRVRVFNDPATLESIQALHRRTT